MRTTPGIFVFSAVLASALFASESLCDRVLEVGTFDLVLLSTVRMIQ